ncbi:MAG: hypothetical protein WCK40_05345 [Thermoleophilia bacterium]
MTSRPKSRLGDPLPQRIAIAIAVPTIALGIFAAGALGASMPTSVPGAQVTASAAPDPATAVPAPAAATAAPIINVVLSRSLAPTIATGYDAWAEGNACAGFPQTKKTDLTVGSDLVGCGKYIKICISGRCVVAQKRDTGPFRDGRHIDMNVGTILALGFRSLDHFGVRKVTWAPVVGNPSRTVASVR